MAAGRQAGETFLGLDIGTSSIKALLIDADQRTLAEASAPLTLSRPHPLWSEQDPDDWVDGVAGRGGGDPRASRRDAFARLAGVGLSGQMHGATFLDGAGKVAAPGDPVERRARLRRMRRARAARARLPPPRRQHRDARLHRAQAAVGRRARAGGLRRDQARPAAEGLCAPAPDRRSGVGNVGRLGHAVARYRQARLGRRIARRDRARRARICRASSKARRSRPISRPKPPPPGALRAGAFRSPAAAGDNAAAAVGVGAVAPGEGFVSLGTSGVVFSVTDRFVCAARAHAARLLPRAAAALARHGGDAVGRRGAVVDRRRARARRRCRRLRRRAPRPSPNRRQAVATAPLFLPYLSGERTPHNDAAATGLFAGLRAEHGAEALVYAVLEGVAFAFADGVDVLSEAGARPTASMLVGGGRALEPLGADDRRRDRPDDRPCRPARRPARRSARRASPCWRPAPATRRAICAPAAGAAPVRARRGARAACSRRACGAFARSIRPRRRRAEADRRAFSRAA